MSTAKRSRQRHSDARASPPLHASKRIKTTDTSHVPARHGGLDFLVDSDARNGRYLDAKLTNGVSKSTANRVDESLAVVAPDVRDENQVGASQQYAIELSSVEDSSSDISIDEYEAAAAGRASGVNGAVDHALPNGHALQQNGDGDAVEDAVTGAEDVDMADEVDGADGDLEEPSFGELLQARHPDPINVQSSSTDPLDAERGMYVITSGERNRLARIGTTLRTVLTQALKTNDREMLERCFQTTDLNDIRATIERLQSQHVATLLQRLAERIHKRPGRTGTLITWIQWSLVAHGAYLASQPEVMKRLRSLHQVLRERANGLQPLLRLKGKLDMLQAQLELRQRMQAVSRAGSVGDDDDEDGVVYVDGQDDDYSDGENAADEEGNTDVRLLDSFKPRSKGQIATPRSDDGSSSDDSDIEDDLPNGIGLGETSEDDGVEGMFDVEAEETSDEGSEADEIESGAGSEDESASSDNEDEIVVKAPKPNTLNRKR